MAAKKKTPSKKGRKPRTEETRTLHVKISVKAMENLERVMEDRRWNKTVATDEILKSYQG